MVFTANVNAVTSYGMSGAACGARLRASAAGGCGPHGSKSRTTTKSFARAGCEGRSCGREPAPAQGACQFIGRKPRVRLGCTAGAPIGVPADR